MMLRNLSSRRRGTETLRLIMAYAKVPHFVLDWGNLLNFGLFHICLSKKDEGL